MLSPKKLMNKIICCTGPFYCCVSINHKDGMSQEGHIRNRHKSHKISHTISQNTMISDQQLGETDEQFITEL